MLSKGTNYALLTLLLLNLVSIKAYILKLTPNEGSMRITGVQKDTLQNKVCQKVVFWVYAWPNACREKCHIHNTKLNVIQRM